MRFFLITSLLLSIVLAGNLDIERSLKRRIQEVTNWKSESDLRAEFFKEIQLEELKTDLCNRSITSYTRRQHITKAWDFLSHDRNSFQDLMLTTCPHHSQSPAEIPITQNDFSSFETMINFLGIPFMISGFHLQHLFNDLKLPNLKATDPNWKGKELEEDAPRVVNYIDQNGNTFLHYAVARDNRIFGLLILKRNPEMICDLHGRTPVHLAAELPNRMEFLKLMILNLPREALNIRNFDNLTPLQVTIARGQFEVASLLAVAMNAEGLAVLNDQKETALTAALKHPETNAPLIKILIQRMNPEDLALQDEHGLMPLHVACARNLLDIALLLAMKMEDQHLSLRTAQFRTPLHFAAAYGALQLIAELAGRMTVEGIMAEDDARNTPIAIARQYQHIRAAELITELLQHKLEASQMNEEANLIDLD